MCEKCASVKSIKRRVVKRSGNMQVLSRLYEEERVRTEEELRGIAQEYLGHHDPHEFGRQMRDALRDYYIRMALIASEGNGIDSWTDAETLLSRQYDYLDGFIDDLEEEELSEGQVLSRAGRYSRAWSVFARYTLPDEIADILPAMPGIDCLGLEACGCWWEFEIYEDGFVQAWWHVNISKEHCPVCLDYAVTYFPFEAYLPGVYEADEDFSFEDWFV